jgi:hypothetical protein
MNKKIKIEDFIQKNREAFDDELPKELSWDFFENNHLELLHKNQKTISVRFLLTAAASVLLFIVSGIVYHFHALEELHQKLAQKDAFSAQSALSEDFVQAEKYYTQQISLKSKELKKKSGKNKFSDTEEEILFLEKEYKMLQNDLKNGVNPKIIAEAMLENLKIRNEILVRQIEALENIQKEMNEHENTSEKNSQGI